MDDKNRASLTRKAPNELTYLKTLWIGKWDPITARVIQGASLINLPVLSIRPVLMWQWPFLLTSASEHATYVFFELQNHVQICSGISWVHHISKKVQNISEPKIFPFDKTDHQRASYPGLCADFNQLMWSQIADSTDPSRVIR